MSEIGPIFIVGCSRSGTTILQQVLNAHPDVAISPETQFVPKYWKQERNYGDLQQKANFDRLLSDIMESPEFKDFGIPQKQFAESGVQCRRTFPAVFDMMMRLFAETQKASVLGEKTPQHVFHIRSLKQAFPSARFIHVVRDPRAVVSSRRKQTWAEDDILSNVLFWRSAVRAALSAKADVHDALVTLRYEDFVTDPATALNGLCERLSLSFHPTMLEHWKGKVSGVDIAREPWKKDVLKAVNTDSLDTWRKELTDEEVLEIERVAWREMHKSGYKRENAFLRLLPQALMHISVR